MFSGDSGNKKHTVTNKLPEEAVFLTKPFAIYFKDGKVSTAQCLQILCINFNLFSGLFGSKVVCSTDKIIISRVLNLNI